MLAGVLYAVEVMQYAYRSLLPQTLSAALGVFDVYPCLSAFTRILPLFMMGVYISYRGEETGKTGTDIAGFAVSAVFLILERNFLIKAGQIAVSYAIWTLPAAYYLFRIVLNRANSLAWSGWCTLGRMSKYIYPLHPMFMEIMNAVPISAVAVRTCIWIVLSMICSYFAVRIESAVVDIGRNACKRWRK